MKRSIQKAVTYVLFVILAGYFLPTAAQATQSSQDPDPHAGHDHASGSHDVRRTFDYSDEMLDAWSHLSVQEGGRVKPLSTLAGFKLLRSNGRRGVKVTLYSPDGEPNTKKITPLVWFLDCVFFPDQARDYPCVLIDFKDVAIAAGLNIPSKKKRDHYSYNEIAPARGTLLSKAQQAYRVDPKKRSVMDKQIMRLARNFLELEDMLRLVNFAEVSIPTNAVASLSAVFPNGQPDLPQFLARSRQIQASLAQEGSTENSIPTAWKSLIGMLEQLRQRNYQGVAFFPPTQSAEDQDEWFAWPDMIEVCLEGHADGMDNIPALEALGKTFRARTDPALFSTEATRFAGLLQPRVEARGEGQRIAMEVQFYKYDFFYRALYLFFLAFIMTAFGWLLSGKSDGGNRLGKIAWGLNLGGIALLTVGIVFRCILRQRPPVSTLYETILFTVAVAVILALFIEWIARNRIGLGLGAFIGAFGMFLASSYELHEARADGDTMGPLLAVLDTNYWLATHVTTISMGYGAGFLAAFMAHVWIFSAFFGKGRNDPSVRKDLARMIYGVLCFSLLFSVLGTLLGGVWANDSWGRFWGWDVKENGALLICIWELLILHMRIGGFIRDFGFALMNVLLGVVVAFSWWGVNLLDVGLHSYGKAEGIETWLNRFYGVEFAIVLIAIALMYSKGLGGKNVPAEQ